MAPPFRSATDAPLLIKLSPNVTSIAEMARVCEGEGADGISLINAVVAYTVLLSILAHGVTAAPWSRAFGARAAKEG